MPWDGASTPPCFPHSASHNLNPTLKFLENLKNFLSPLICSPPRRRWCPTHTSSPHSDQGSSLPGAGHGLRPSPSSSSPMPRPYSHCLLPAYGLGMSSSSSSSRPSAGHGEVSDHELVISDTVDLKFFLLQQHKWVLHFEAFQLRPSFRVPQKIKPGAQRITPLFL